MEITSAATNDYDFNLSSTKDWFEFLLDLELVDKHLRTENPEPNACSLIIHFLYHANLTEQLFNPNVKPAPNTEQQPVEIKTKRIKVLRILAIKAAAILNWNLQVMEKEIPVAVMSDLLHILLQLGLTNSDNKPHIQLDLKAVESYALFALQLLHRWIIRTSIQSKYPVKPSKTIQVTVPGIINPLQHMKEANENILKTLTPASLLESVEFLEKFLLNLSDDLVQPTSSSFTNISSETGEYDLVWDSGVKYSEKECQLMITYDLAQYYFNMENYQKCYNLLSNNLELFYSIKEKHIRVYCEDYESLLVAAKSIASIDETLEIMEEAKTIQSIKRVENSVQNGFQGIFELLIEDNKKNELSITYRLGLEKQSLELNNSEIVDQICSCNLVRFVHDDYYSYKNYDLSKLTFLSKAILQSHTNSRPKAKANLNVFLELNYKHLNKKCIQELECDPNYSFLKVFNQNSEQQQQMEYQEAPSSPTETQSSLFSNNATTLEYVQLALKSVDSVLIKHAVSNYNQQTQNKGMKNYCPSEWNIQSVLEHLQPQQQTIFQNSLSKLNSVNDSDIIQISLAKIKRLKKTKKYDLALKLLKSLEEPVKNNENLTKYIVNETLILNIKKIMNDSKTTRFHDQMLGNCKTFINNSIKSDVDMISADAIRTSFAFIINSNEYRFIENLNTQKTTNNMFSGYIELSKKLVRFYNETQNEKSDKKRKLARELWDCVTEIFHDTTQTKRPIGDQSSDTTISRESHTSCVSREAFRKYIRLINNPQILSILFSLISTLYSIRDISCNTEINSEHRQLWPSSVANMHSINLNFIHDIINILIKQCLCTDPFNTVWLRTIGDIYFSQILFSESFKYYLKFIISETKYFSLQSQIQRVLSEKLLKNMIRECYQMNKYTHVICLCQYLPVIDYTTAFKCYQEEYCTDTMDDLYHCIWDVTLLEYLIYINAKRCYFDKRNLGMDIMALPETNESNPKEIREKNVELKRVLLFVKLTKYHFI